MGAPSDADQALSADIYELILDLREHRRAPDEAAWGALRSRMTGLADRLRSGPQGHERFVVSGLERVEQVAGEVP